MAKKRRKAASKRGLSGVLRAPQFPASGNLEELYQQLLALPNVEGCYIGRRRKTVESRGTRTRTRRERKETRQLAVICCVAQKIDEKRLHPAHKVPERITWPRTRSKRFHMLTDVQPVGARQLQQLASVVGPGDVLQASPGTNGLATIGIAMKHPELGVVVTTAGHAFLGSSAGTKTFPAGAASVQISNAGPGAAPGSFRAVPIKAVRSPKADYALLRPTAEARNLFHDTVNLPGPFVPLPGDVGTRLFALTRNGHRRTTLRGVAATLVMGNVQMRGLMFTDEVTVPGDSGCCLVDASSRVWGLLVGLAEIDGQPRSVFASANMVLALENAEMA